MKLLKSVAVVGCIVAAAIPTIVSLSLISVRASVWLLGPSWRQGALTDRDVQTPALQAVDGYLREHSRYKEGLRGGMKRYDKSIVSVVTWSDGDVNVFIANGVPQLFGVDGLPWPVPGAWVPMVRRPQLFQTPHPVLMFALHPGPRGYVCVGVEQGDPQKPFDYTSEGVIVRIDVLRMALSEREPETSPPAPDKDSPPARRL